MKRISESSARRFLLWFFDAPRNDPYVSLTFDVNVEPALGFLDAFNREHPEQRIGVQHLMTKAVARCLGQVAPLNVKVFGRRIYQLDRVDIAMPVHLGAADSSGGDETGVLILRDADKKSLLEIARETRSTARAERSGEASAGGSATLRRWAKHIPRGVMYAGLEVTRALLQNPLTYGLLEGRLGASSAVTNVGAVFSLPAGARFRAGSASLPAKAGHFASVFGVAPIERAAVIEDGAIVSRKVLPVMMMVDHRAIDGVLMARAGAAVAAALLDPASLTQ